MATATLIAENIPGWAPVTNLYQTSDGKYLAVDSGEPLDASDAAKDIGINIHMIMQLPRATVVIECDENGAAPHLTPLHELPPGTSYGDALKQAGYDLR